MKFGYGIYAEILTENEDNSATYRHYSYDSDDVYEYLELLFGHEVAEEASSWTELNCYADAEYDGDKFIITMIERME